MSEWEEKCNKYSPEYYQLWLQFCKGNNKVFSLEDIFNKAFGTDYMWGDFNYIDILAMDKGTKAMFEEIEKEVKKHNSKLYKAMR